MGNQIARDIDTAPGARPPAPGGIKTSPLNFDAWRTRPPRARRDPVCTHDGFTLFRTLQTLLPPGGYDLSRGDPRDPSSPRAMRVAALFENFTADVLALMHRRGCSPAHLPADLIEGCWARALAAARPRARRDAMVVLRELVLSCAPADATLGAATVAALRELASDTAGKGYREVAGRPHIRATVARHLLRSIAAPPSGSLPPLDAESINLTMGANEAIGSLFRLLRRVGYLRRGALVGMAEPLYSPYLELARGLDLRVVPLPSDPAHGYEPTDADVAHFEGELHRLGKPLKLFCAVHPGNPSASAWSQAGVERVVAMLRRQACPVVEDVVYHEFLPQGRFHSLWAHLPEQTVLLHSMSKFYRASGDRLGIVAITDGANEWLTAAVLGTPANVKASLGAAVVLDDFRTLAATAKGPGPGSTMAHTTEMPLVMQVRLVIRLLIDWDTSGAAYTRALHERWTAFYHGLGLPTPAERLDRATGAVDGVCFVPYYALIDVREVVGATADGATREAVLRAMDEGRLQPWDVFCGLARAGVALMPAARFFSAPEPNRWMVRASVANQPLEHVLDAAARVRSYFAEMAAQSGGGHPVVLSPGHAASQQLAA